ncbi:MAG: RNA polymerase sigma factor [Acetobacteraceae bacterium]
MSDVGYQDTSLARRSPGERELLALLRLGDSAAFTVLMRRSNRRLYRLARSILKDDAEAEDAVQETYVRAFNGLKAFRNDASLSTWLSRIAINEALACLRKRRPVAGLEEVDEMAFSSGIPELAAFGIRDRGNPEELATRHEVRMLLERAIDTLPTIFRTVFVLRAVEQMSVEETADCLDIPGETVKTRFHRAKNLLRKALGIEMAALLPDTFPFAGPRCDRIVAATLVRLERAEPPRSGVSLATRDGKTMP